MVKILGLQGVVNGIIMMILVVVPALYLHDLTKFHFFEEIEYSLLFIVSCFSVYYGVLRTREIYLSGHIKYGKALLFGLVIMLISGLVYSILWNGFHLLSGIDLDQKFMEAALKEMRMEGATEEDIEDARMMSMVVLENPSIRLASAVAVPLIYGIFAPFCMAFFVRKKNLS